MIGTMAKDTPGEICQEILDHEEEVVGLVAFAFLDTGELTWGMTGMVPTSGLVLAELQRIDHLAAMPPEGRA